jgi:hypothetical protein
VVWTSIDSARFEAHGWRIGWRRLQSALTVLKIRGSGNAERHDLHEILILALCWVLCGGQTAVDMHPFARAKAGSLRGFLTLQNGLPSQDRISWVFRRLDPDQFRACFQRFMARFAQNCHCVIAIDGTVVRRSFDTASANSPLHRVSAWGCEQPLVLAQIATDATSHEMTAGCPGCWRCCR